MRCQLLKNSSKSNYKYSQELNFLKKHVKLKIQSNQGESSQTQENYEFEITEEDLRLHDNEEDLSSIFIEFDDKILFDGRNQEKNKDSSKVQEQETEKDKSNETDEEQIELMIEEIEEAEISTTTLIKDQSEVIEVAPVASISVPDPLPAKPPTTDPSIRNEDVIFGELIVSQLLKISDEAKKRSIKRSILDLFF